MGKSITDKDKMNQLQTIIPPKQSSSQTRTGTTSVSTKIKEVIFVGVVIQTVTEYDTLRLRYDI